MTTPPVDLALVMDERINRDSHRGSEPTRQQGPCRVATAGRFRAVDVTHLALLVIRNREPYHADGGTSRKTNQSTGCQTVVGTIQS